MNDNAAKNLRAVANKIFNVAESNITERSSGRAAVRWNGNH